MKKLLCIFYVSKETTKYTVTEDDSIRENDKKMSAIFNDFSSIFL